MSYCLIFVKKAIINKPTNKCALLVGLKIDSATMENNMDIPQNTKNRTTISPSNSTSGYLSEETQNTNFKRYMHPYVHYSLIYNCQNMEATYVLIDKCMDKEKWCIYTMEYYSAIIKSEILPFTTMWRDRGGIILSKISQRKEKPYAFIAQGI